LATGDEYDVSFLGYPHRHIFHFKVAIQVFHNDRDIEFIQFKRWLENSFRDGVMKLDHKSCEMISDELYMYIANRYPDRDIEITVSEDGENGATIYYNTTKPYQSLVI
jgi:tRNA isopentenyl-2-thiomethyl-A-37 hydroxylase MiaE